MCSAGSFRGTRRRRDGARNDRDPRFGHAAPCLGLVSHRLDGLRGGANENETGLLYGRRKRGPFSEESISGVDGARPRAPGHLDEIFPAEVALR